MDNHQWRLSQAYTYAFHISIHISITLIPYHLIFLLHVNLFLLHVLCLWHIPYLYFFCIPIFILYIFLYLSCAHLSRLSYVFYLFLVFVKLHIMSLVYVFFIFRFYDLLHSSLSYLYSRILSCYIRSSCTFHILLSYTIHILHIHLYVLILSIIYFVILYTFYTFLVFIYLFSYQVIL